MKLHELFAHFERMHRGLATTVEVRRAIYGDVESADARRLSLYNHVGSTRSRELAASFPQVARVLGPRFDAIALAYFIEHPWGRFDYRPDGAALSTFLGRDPTIPPWLLEVARLEWGKAVAAVSLPVTEPSLGELRLAPGVGLHRLDYDSARWMMQIRERSPEPVPWRGAAVTWRGQQALGRVGPLDATQLAMLEQIQAGTLDLTSLPGEHDKIARSFESFVTTGVVVGDASAVREALLTSATFQLAPFAHFYWVDGIPVISAPGAREAISADEPVLLAIVNRLARPCTLEALTSELELELELARGIVAAMLEAGLVTTTATTASAVDAVEPPPQLVELLARAGISPPLWVDVRGDILAIRASADDDWFATVREAGALQQRLVDIGAQLGIELVPATLVSRDLVALAIVRA